MVPLPSVPAFPCNGKIVVFPHREKKWCHSRLSLHSLHSPLICGFGFFTTSLHPADKLDGDSIHTPAGLFPPAT